MKISGSKRIAERYVKALFEVAQAESALKNVEADLKMLGAAIHESPEFQDFLTNPLLSHEVRAQAMLAILAKMNVHQLTRQFTGMLISQKRLAILPDIIALFAQWAANERGELKGELISASPLKLQEVATISERLSRAYGKKVNLEVRQQPELLGGIVVRIGSQQLDSSLSGKLSRLGIALKAA